MFKLVNEDQGQFEDVLETFEDMEDQNEELITRKDFQTSRQAKFYSV